MTKRPNIDDAPGLVWRPRKDGWEARWQCRSDIARAGYQPKSEALWVGAIPSPLDIHTIRLRCCQLQSGMKGWAWSNKPPLKRDGKAIQWIKAHVGHDGDECLIYPFSRDTSGYGTVYVNYKGLRAHRVMCELVNGAPPTPAHHAAHSCGNGHLGCIHPKHLSWKTNSENQLDRRLHGTQIPKGRPKNKLNMTTAAQIKALRGSATHETLGRQFGVSRDTIGKVLNGHTWKSA